MLRRVFFIAVLFLACGLFAGEETPARVSILQTTDVHGILLSGDGSPGFLKLASAIRREYDPEKTLLVDCGDSFEGSFENVVTEGGIMVSALNALPYDAWIPHQI